MILKKRVVLRLWQGALGAFATKAVGLLIDLLISAIKN